MNKKIIIIANTSWYLFNFRLNLMLFLRELGYQPIALAPLDDYSTRFEQYQIPFIPIAIDNKGTNPLTDSLLIAKLALLFAKEKPAAILSYTPKCNIYASLAARLIHIPIINNISGLGSVFIKEGMLAQLVTSLYKIALKKSATVFFQNKDDLALFINKALVTKSITALLPGSGVDTEAFAPVKFSKNDNRFIFLCVARLLKDKGIVELVEATRLLKSQYPSIECHLVGFLDAKNPTAISAVEMQQWLDERVITYLGVSDNVKAIIPLADCVVLPSYREGTPRSLLEAASMAKPIITTDAVGCREVVDDGINGFLCQIKNSLDLKDKMEAMFLLSNEQREQMGNKGREKMIQQFNETIVLEQYAIAIKKIAS
jgi:glycosyltransferase involved in cell wall biosynthesis